jgi:hypothetical protein
MNLAETIVARLLDEMSLDIRQHPGLIQPTGKIDQHGKRIHRVCSYCEAEYGSNKQYPPGVSMSHSVCTRHLVQQFMSDLGYTREEAMSKIPPGDSPPDWQEVLGDSPAVAAAPKATFWATSGSGGV